MAITLKHPTYLDGEDEEWYACVDCDSSDTYRKYPLSMLVEYAGKYYCAEHWDWRFRKRLEEEGKIEFPDEKA